MGKVVRFVCLLLALATCASLYAEIEFPPELKTPQEIERYVQRIQVLVPQVNTSSTHPIKSIHYYVQEEQNLIRKLKQDTEYMALAKQRPPLQTLSISKVTTSVVTGLGVNSQWGELLKNNGSSSAANDQSEIRAQLTELFKRWPSISLSGFFSAWAGLLPKEDRSVLRNQNIEQRWAQLKEILNTQDIRELRKKFKAEKFGVNIQDWNWRDLDKVVNEMIRLENRIAVLIQQLNPERSTQNEAWFNMENIDEWHDFSEFGGRIEKLLSGLKERLADTYSDPNASMTKEVASRELILRELPPYLAIYRGCVGSDCSTSHSWAFPYAPAERDWWVETPDGARLGYVSGAITRLGGEPCLYIRDVTGPNITPEDIKLILDGFYAAKEMYGAHQMTIMTTGFTVQNHFPKLEQALRAYQQGKAPQVTQQFTDEPIRVGVLGAQPASGLTYDNPTYHQNVRLIALTAQDLADVRVKRVSGLSAMRDPNKDANALWDLLQSAVLSNSEIIVQSNYERQVDWRALISTLRNERGLPVKDYYEAVEKQFASEKLPFSRNMMRKNRQLFQLGHMAAPDAFRDENVHQSVRYVTDMIWRGKAEEQETTQIVRNNLSVLEENELFTRSVQGLFERRQPDDVQRLDLLFKAGFRFEHVQLTPSDLKWMSQSLNQPDINEWALDKMLKSVNGTLTGENISVEMADTIAGRLNNEDESVDENLSIKAAKMYYDIHGLVGATGVTRREALASIEDDENPDVRVPLTIAYLRDYGQNGDPNLKVVATTLAKDLQENLVPQKYRAEAARLLQTYRTYVDNCDAALTPSPPPTHRGARRSNVQRAHTR